MTQPELERWLIDHFDDPDKPYWFTYFLERQAGELYPLIQRERLDAARKMVRFFLQGPGVFATGAQVETLSDATIASIIGGEE